MPRASTSTTTAVNAGRFDKLRTAKRMSFNSDSMMSFPIANFRLPISNSGLRISRFNRPICYQSSSDPNRLHSAQDKIRNPKFFHSYRSATNGSTYEHHCLFHHEYLHIVGHCSQSDPDSHLVSPLGH